MYYTFTVLERTKAIPSFVGIFAICTSPSYNLRIFFNCVVN
jgi:hypothetical protein